MIERVEYPGLDEFSIMGKVQELIVERLAKEPHLYGFLAQTSNKMDWTIPEELDERVIRSVATEVLGAVMVGHLANGEDAFFGGEKYELLRTLPQFLERVRRGQTKPATRLVGWGVGGASLDAMLLGLPQLEANLYFPVDDVAAEAAMEDLMQTETGISLVNITRKKTPRWIDTNHAKFQLRNGGASIFGFASDGGSIISAETEPEIVLSAIGAEETKEMLKAMELLRSDGFLLKMRFVGIAALTTGAIGTSRKKLSQTIFDQYFTRKRPIIINCQDNEATLKAIFGNYTDLRRVTIIEGEQEDELLRSRYEIAARIAKIGGQAELVKKYKDMARERV